MRIFFYVACADGEIYTRALISCDLAKIDLFGVDYIFENVKEFIKQQQYQNYITDNIKSLIEIIVKVCGSDITLPRYYDMICPSRKSEEKSMSAEEIINEVVDYTGITMVGGEA